MRRDLLAGLDQGSEWAEWAILAATYNIDCWFCDPHSPWHRGQIENLNRQWRFWFPRGTRLDTNRPSRRRPRNGQRGRHHLNNHCPAMLYAAATASVH